ncbi:MAG: lytic transglycosylase domain-containing protein [Elusimicrobia bacterium]|jgi:soluble lytic murein transglycosylase|nr:lytic transglycosylase domain-containing protein [Elusimicrobiota bacterium]
MRITGRRLNPRRRGKFIGVIFLCGVVVFLGVQLVWRAARPLMHMDLIETYATAENFDPFFVLALVRVESGFSKTAKSHRGAVGLMQLMPETGKEMAMRLGMDPAQTNLADPETNIRLGVHYLGVLRQEFGEDPVALLAAYNGGPRNVRKWIKNGPLTIQDIPFSETRTFVTRVLATEKSIRRLQQVKGFFHD